MSVNWPRFCEVIQQSQKVILTSHIRPDCDALGSCLGMAGILEALGKEVRIVCGQPVPANLKFIDPENRIMCINEDIQAEDLADALRAGEIAGAGIDTLDVEPPPADHPLLESDIPNLIVTPHNAWGSRTARQAGLDQLAEVVQSFQQSSPVNVVNSF